MHVRSLNGTTMTDAAVANASDICVGCGLCCNGVLYRRARAELHEHEQLSEAGHTLEDLDEKSYFVLPCQYESCGRCTIYESRYTVCRTFRCALLRQVESGEIPAADARQVVDKTLALIEQVKVNDPEAHLYLDRLRIRRSLTDEIRVQSGEERNRTGRRLLAMAALDSFLDRWFRNKKGGEDPA